MQPDLMERLAGVVRDRTGLDVSGHRRDDLRRAVDSLAPRSDSPERILDDPLLFEQLVRVLTIGETMFFRHAEQFQLLTSHILPSLIARRRAEGPHCVRIWSAGCATGEEPYSIALALSELLPDAPTWTLTVLGTDLNPDFLAAARDAAYGEWSFRGCEARLREHFTLRGKQWHLDPRVRDLVTFAPLNLATDDYPTNVDVIFCRNVLIYFDAQTRRRVLTRLRDSLAPEGWLITGHADLGGDDIAGLQPRLGAESFAWQRSEVQTETAPCTTPSPPPVAIRRPPPPRRVPRREPDARSLFETAARLIDRGEDEAAAETLRRSLYLDPRQPAAHYLAGLIAGRRGSRRNAARHFRAAIVTLSTLADDVVLDGTEGITAGRLRQTLDALLRESSEVMHA